MIIDIQWKRLSVEAFVIVASILLAFSIDAWWDTRQSVSRERELLASLELGIQNHIAQAENAIDLASQSLQKIRSFISSDAEDFADRSSQSAYDTLRALYQAQGLAQGLLDSRSILATLDSDRLSVSSDPDLIAALIEWQGELETLEERNFDVLSTTQRVMDALAAYPEVQLTLSRPPEERSASASLLVDLRQDNEVMRRLASRAYYASLQLAFLNRVKDRAQRVNEFIQAQIYSP